MLDFLIKLLDKLHVFFSKDKPKETEVAQDDKEVISPPMEIEKKEKLKGMLYAKNDSQRIRDELVDLEEHNPGLHSLIIDLYKWIAEQFEKDTIITMIYRTQKEQDEIYSYSEKYKEKPWKSPHQLMHAIDLRSRIYTQEEIDKIVKYLNDKYNDTNYYKWTAKCHEVGNNGKHFHLQYVKN